MSNCVSCLKKIDGSYYDVDGSVWCFECMKDNVAFTDYKGSEEVCECGKPLGEGKDCSFCKSFAESKTLGEQ